MQNLLGGGQQDPQKQSIFAAQDAQQPAGQVQQQAPNARTAQVKTSTEGEVGSAAQAGGAGTGGEAPAATPQRQDSQVIKKNVGKVQTPGFAGRIGEALDVQERELADEATKYVQGARGIDYDVGDDVIRQAVEGGAENDAYSKVVGLLGRAPTQAEAFKPSDVSVDDVARLESEKGVQNLIMREAGPGRLNSNEAEFDARLLYGNPEFQRVRQALSSRQEDLRGRAGLEATDRTTEAQGILDAELSGAQARARTGLEGIGTGLTADIQTRVDEINRARKALRQNPDQAFIDAAVTAEMDKLMAANQDPYGVGSYVDDALAELDPSKYYNVAGDVTLDDMRTAEEAAKFNNIMRLLGKGDIYYGGAGAGESQSFGNQALSDALYEAAKGKNEAADALARKKYDDLKASLEGKFQERADTWRQQEARNILDVLKGKYGNEDLLAGITLRPEDYYNIADYRDILSRDEAAKLNEYSREFGGDTFAEGKGYGATFNTDQYQKDLEAALLDAIAKREFDKQAAQSGETAYGSILSALKPTAQQAAAGPGGLIQAASGGGAAGKQAGKDKDLLSQAAETLGKPIVTKPKKIKNPFG